MAGGQGQGFVDGRFERNVLAAAALLVGGDDGDGASIENALFQRLGGEAAEHHRMNGTDAGAGLHGGDAFDGHGQVDQDAVALLDALSPQCVGKLGHLGQHLLVSYPRHRTIIGFEDDGDFVAQAGFDVLVQAVVRNIELAVGEPLVERCVRLIQRLGERLLPDDVFLGQSSPVARIVTVGLFAQGLVGSHAGHGGVLDGLFGRGEYPVLLENRFDSRHVLPLLSRYSDIDGRYAKSRPPWPILRPIKIK